MSDLNINIIIWNVSLSLPHNNATKGHDSSNVYSVNSSYLLLVWKYGTSN